MKKIFCFILLYWLTFSYSLVVFSQDASEKQLTYTTTNNQTIAYTLITIYPPFTIKADYPEVGKNTAIGCCLMFHKYLASADLTSAAALSNNPKRTEELYTTSIQGSGKEAFIKAYKEGFFCGRNQILYEIVIAPYHLLVIDIPDYNMFAGQPYQEKDATFWVAEDLPAEIDKSFDTLFEAFKAGDLHI